jgi:hypothetical protein
LIPRRNWELKKSLPAAVAPEKSYQASVLFSRDRNDAPLLLSAATPKATKKKRKSAISSKTRFMV